MGGGIEDMDEDYELVDNIPDLDSCIGDDATPVSPFASADNTADAVVSNDPTPNPFDDDSMVVVTQAPDQLLDPAPFTALYNLIGIKSDKQDLSFVEKVLLTRDDVFAFFNAVSPGSVKSAAAPGGRWILDLSRLDKSFLSAVGLYGSKRILADVLLQQLCKLPEDTARQLREDSLPPGLYGALSGEMKLVLFYWQPDKKFSAARRGDISCNFIRYLLNLCDVVYCCMDVEDGGGGVSSVVKVADNKNRIQRLQISVVSSSGNDFAVMPGFELPLKGLPDLACGFASTMWSEGCHRCALLVPWTYTPEKTLLSGEFTAAASDVPGKMAKEWDGLVVDSRKLNETGFLLFANAANLDGFEGLSHSLQELERSMDVELRKLRNTEDYLTKRVIAVLQVLADGLKAYLRLYYSWEECVEEQPECQLEDASILNFIEYCEKQTRSTPDLDRTAVNSLESKLSSELNNSRGSIVFIGSKVTLDIDSSSFTIASDKSSTGPVMYEELLSARYDRDTIKFKVSASGRSGPVFSEDKFKVEVISGVFNWKGRTHHHVGFTKVDNCGFMNWIDSLARMLIVLKKKTLLADFVIAHRDELGVRGELSDIDLSQAIFADKGKFNYTTRASVCRERWKEIISLPLPRVLEVKEGLLPRYVEYYRTVRTKILSNVFESFCDIFFDSLKGTATLELEKKREQLGDDTRSKKAECISKFRDGLLDPEAAGPRVILNSCETSYDGRIRLRFKREFPQNERVVWKAVELLPQKKDLEQDSQQLILPGCSRWCELVEIEAAEFELAKVVFLKSGQLLVFVRGLQSSQLSIYLSSNLGGRLSVPCSRTHVKTFSRGVDLVAYDEALRFIALYDVSASTIKVYRFDELFRELVWNGVTILLSNYIGSGRITWMEFITGKAELLVADETLCVRVFEAVQPGMMKPRVIQLSDSFLRPCLTADGLCLIAVCGVPIEDHGVALSAEVFRLDDRLERIKTVDLGVAVRNSSNFQLATANFGKQMQMLIYDGEDPEMVRSLRLKVTVPSQSCQLVRESTASSSKPDVAESSEASSICHELDYLYHVFDKYAVSPPLIKSARALRFGMIVDVRKGEPVAVKKKLIDHAKRIVHQLEKDKGKDFSGLEIAFDLQIVKESETIGIHPRERNMSEFLRQLMSLVPVQIARAQNNNLRPLIDGLEMSADASYGDAIQLANIVQFSVYDALLESWTGPVKVVSSMGKQSSGKSYLLNHLSGSVLDVAGGRCTDGVWMTCRVSDECMFVILDFEGLGSFERSEQEDMLLAILNAAISNITLFNKKDFHLDKETEAVFDRFQNGVSLVKDDDKLFKGLFYMAIKDVDAADVDDLREEFFSKIQYICNKSKDNFLTRMYGGLVEISAMPPFNRREFHDSISQIAVTVEGIDAVHKTGKSFLRDLKLVIAQICSKDWSPMDTKRIAFKVSMLREHLSTAIAFGCLAGSERKELVDFDSEEKLEDPAVVVDGIVFDVPDTRLQLAGLGEMDVANTVLEKLIPLFEKVVPREERLRSDEEWHADLEVFLGSLAERRKTRVMNWIRANTKDFSSDGDVQKLLLEVAAAVADVKDKLALCSCKCEQCFLRCILEKSHPGHHHCKGSHRCKEYCSFCKEKEASKLERCVDKAGHEGLHDCKLESHTCGEPCHLWEKSSNCNKTCALKIAHEGDHTCNSKHHMCKDQCSLPGCNNTCVYPLEIADHTHACHEKMCVNQCSMDGCNRKCATEDHFHSITAEIHLCGNEHQCASDCDCKGNCVVLTEVLKKTRTFQGKRSTFEYDYVSEQNGKKKMCCVPIPPFEMEHSGQHLHTVNPDAVHFCDAKCLGCGYFCHLPIDHPGLHDTTHGNMTQKTFVAESEEVEIEGRKYEWGESGAAEMCMMHCKARGRGHVHLIPCEEGITESGVCGKVKFLEGARHQSRKYGPDFDSSKDELTHATYWKNMKFKDPCSEEDQNEFGLCGHCCQSAEHNAAASSSSGGSIFQSGKSYCTEKLWHDPVPRTVSYTGYVTEDGHSFACNHAKDVSSHVVFVVDRSGSMGSPDMKPKMVKFPSDRLGCVFEAMVRFIRTRIAANLHDTMTVVLFDDHAQIALEREAMSEAQVDKLLSFEDGGGTVYSAGLGRVEEVLKRAARDQSVAGKSPAVVFLSDGDNFGGLDPVHCVNQLKKLEPSLIFHTIMFGTDPTKDAKKLLADMAAAGNGMFQVSIDEIQLSRSFEDLAKSLRPKVAALM